MKQRKQKERGGPRFVHMLLLVTVAVGLTMMAGTIDSGEPLSPANNITAIAGVLIMISIMFWQGFAMVQDGDWAGYVIMIIALIAIPWNTQFNGEPSMTDRTVEFVEWVLPVE